MGRIYPYSVFVLALLLFMLCPGAGHAKGPIRIVEASTDRIARVRTALGYSTVIELPSKPLQAVLGDQDAFKLEFVGQSVTLKPLIAGAKSNLFLFTEWGRFPFLISTGPATQADLLIRVRYLGADTEKESVHRGHRRRIRVEKKSSAQGFTLKALDLDLSPGDGNSRSASILRFEIASSITPYAFQPASVGIKQGLKFIEIEQIYLDRLDVGPKSGPVGGTIAILNRSWKRNLPLSLIFAVKGKSPKPVRLKVVVYGGNAKGGHANGAKTPALFQTKSR
jgi:hypothetical protein